MMKSVRGVVCAVTLVASAGVAFAEVAKETVADTPLVLLHNAYSFTKGSTHYELAATNVLTVQTKAQEGYPAGVVAPAFWLDCSDTTGWGFTTEDGKPVVTNIPSKAGSTMAGTRWLTTRPGGGDWVGWSDGASKPNPPWFATNETGALGNGGNYLDFGNKGSARGLLFNTDGDGYNALRTVGTIVAVWGTDVRFGGHLMGGGATKDYGWHRAGDVVSSVHQDNGAARWSAYVMNGNAQSVALNGTLWHDGNVARTTSSSFNGGWEVLSFQATAATAETCGIGINDKRTGMGWVSGGQEVAELLIFDSLLSREDMEKVEIYLEQKWFGRRHAGWNGAGRAAVVNAYSGNQQIEVDVPADETLEIDRLTGGTRTSSSGAWPKLTKTGAGTLVFAGEGAQNYSAEIVLDEGEISFPAVKAVPTAETLPAYLYARFDASDATLTTDADGKVSRWDNSVVGDDARNRTRPFSLQQNVAASRPTLVEDEFGPGLNVVDFGVNAYDGATMWFSTNSVADTKAGSNNGLSLPGVQTVVVLLGAQQGGGTLFNNADYKRAYPDSHSFRHGITGVNRMYIDGRPWDPAKGYEREGYQVVSYETKGSEIGALMRSERVYGDGYWHGGARIAELLIWNRALTEDEILSAHAYLMAKWFKREAPGHARPADAFAAADLQFLTVPSGKRVTLHVGAGRTVRVGTLKASGELVKTGDGDLEIEKAEFPYETGKVTIQGGTAKVVGVRDVGAASELAPGATLHLDVSDTKRLTTKMNGSEECIKVWRDEEDRVGLWSTPMGGLFNPDSVGSAPSLTDAETLNGYRTANFKTWGSGKWMVLDRPIHSIRAVYAVIKCHGKTDAKGNVCSGGWIFSNGDGLNGDAGGTVYNWYPWREEDDITFHPGLTGGLWDGRLINGYNPVFTGTGSCLTNGVSVGYNTFKVATNVYQLVELHAAWGVPAGVVGLDREITDRSGGFAIAELVAYERPLSEREKVATRNHLMRKWIDPDYADELPPVPEKTKLLERTIEVDGELTKDCAEDADLATLSGEGTFTKTGAGALSFFDISGFSGTVNVAEGALAVKGADLEDAGELVTDGIVYHADATKGVTTTLNEAHNAICVSEWASQTENGYKAVRSGADVWNQTLVYDPDLAYKPTVDMMGYDACFRWQDRDGNWLNISGIKSVFWLIGSQNGGGFLLGGGTNGTGQLSHMWHRDIYYPNYPELKPAYVGNTNLCNIVNGNMQAAAKNADWYKNGVQIYKDGKGTGKDTTYLSGKWDVVSMLTREGEQANADGLAFDGRSRKASGATNPEYSGYQRLAELIVYDRRVSDEERVQIENYLRSKWLFGVHPAAENVTVNVAADASLVLGGAQRFAGLKGAGTVEGDVSAMTLVADGAATAWPTVNGTFTIPEGVTVDFSNVDASTLPVEVKILTATSVAGYEFAKNVSYTGVTLGAGDKVNLRFRNGTLSAVIKPGGSLILVR